MTAAFRNRLVIMARAPVAGAVKTRLARGIGLAAATGFYRAVLAQTLRRLAADPRWETWLAVTPDTAVGAAAWPRHVDVVAQGPGDLGTRMQAAFDAMPEGPVVIVGSDIPDLVSEDVAAAFRALGPNEAVFGPAADGGYWLIGLRRSPRILRPVAGVRWSGRHAIEDTCRNLTGRRVALLRTLDDIDAAAEYRRWRERRRRPAQGRSGGRQTASW
jgi:rSAM/selenodomain-associated transferase 1